VPVNLLLLTSGEGGRAVAPASVHRIDIEADPTRLLSRLADRAHHACLVDDGSVTRLSATTLATARALCPAVPLALLVERVSDRARRAALLAGLDGVVGRDEDLDGAVAGLIDARGRRTGSAVRRRVLLVGDPPGPIGQAAGVLREAAFDVTSVPDGFEALRLLRSRAPHVLIVDASLEQPSAEEVLDSARRYEPITATLAIAEADRVDVITALLGPGLATVLVAPVEPQLLLDAVSLAWECWSVEAGRRELLRESPGTSPRPTLRTLLVEDDPSFGRSLRRVLRDTADGAGGCEVEQVTTLAAATERLASSGIELVIADLGLPDSDGLATLVSLQARAPRIPIVVLSGSTDVRMAELAVRCGAQDYISKGTLVVEDLKARLYFARQRHKMVRELQRSGRELHAMLGSQRSLVFASAEAMLLVGYDGSLHFANAAAEELFGRPVEALREVVPTLPLEPGTRRPVTIDRGDEVRQAEARVARSWWRETPVLLVTLHETTHLLRAEEELRLTNSRLEEANRALQELASLDPLTGLPNRRGLARVLDAEASRALRQGSALSALLLDCDDFKLVNDRLGHAVGDLVLRELAGRLTGALRPEDCVGRLGGDEFLVLLPNTREGEARQVAERLRRAVLDESIRHREESIRVTASFGLAVLPHDVCAIDEVLALTRLGLARSKRSGKNAVNTGGPRDDTAIQSDPALGALRHEDGFLARVQGIVDLRTEEVVGHELLSRARVEGLRSPDQFFRTADEAQILTLVDLNCLKVCLAEAGRRGLSGRVHVNLFPSTLLGTSPEALLERFAPGIEAGLDYCVEISEQQFIGDPSVLKRAVRRLNEAGVHVAIDDVGFGRTSLETLLVLEPQVVKIDRSYVHGAASDPGLRHLLVRLVQAMTGLNCELIAEGIERVEDLELVRELGIDLGQGFYWGRPA